MKKILLLFLFILSYSGYSQSINGKLENAHFESRDACYYVYNLENSRIFHIRKYNDKLELVASYDKKLEDKVYDEIYYVNFKQNEISVDFQMGKFKFGFKPKPVPGFKLLISYDLKEIEADRVENIGVLAYRGANTVRTIVGPKYKQYGTRGDANGSNSFDTEAFDTEVKQKNNIKDVGPMVSMVNDKKTETFQMANYKDNESKRLYNGFYVLTEKDKKVLKFQKYNFLDFKGVNSEKSAFMQFCPDFVIKTEKSFVIPFIQKVHRKEKYSSGTGIDKHVGELEVDYIIGVGVIELDKTDGTIKSAIFDRKGPQRKLKNEILVGFQGTGIADFRFLLRSSPTAGNVFKNTCWSSYDQNGEVFQECDKNNVYEFIDNNYLIKFESGNSGYSLTKTTYK